MIQIKVWEVPLSAASVEKVRYDIHLIQDDLIVMTFHNNQVLCQLFFLTACEQCMKPADVHCMKCRINYCRCCSNICNGHKSRAYHSVRRLEDFDTEDEKEITSSQTGMHSERTLLTLQEVIEIYLMCVGNYIRVSN